MRHDSSLWIKFGVVSMARRDFNRQRKANAIEIKADKERRKTIIY